MAEIRVYQKNGRDIIVQPEDFHKWHFYEPTPYDRRNGHLKEKYQKEQDEFENWRQAQIKAKIRTKIVDRKIREYHQPEPVWNKATVDRLWYKILPRCERVDVYEGDNWHSFRWEPFSLKYLAKRVVQVNDKIPSEWPKHTLKTLGL